MDRLNRLRGEPGGSRDSTLDTTSPPSEGFLTANESSSKYFSLSEVDSTFDISTIKDSPLTSAATDAATAGPSELIPDLSPMNKTNELLDSYKIGKLSEASEVLSGCVDIFDDNDNSYDGDELVIDDNVPVDLEEKAVPDVKPVAKEVEAIPSKDTEVVLQIKGRRVEAIDIGNGLYLYRTEGEKAELAAVQVIDPEQQPPNYKFLKVRVNDEGNLEVYEEIEVVVPKKQAAAEVKASGKNPAHVPIKDIDKVIGDASSSKAAETNKAAPKETPQTSTSKESNREPSKHQLEGENFNGKMKFSEAKKSPVISSFTPMIYHSTPNKEGIPLTKTMVDMQLHTGRHSDSPKKTIEVNTETCKMVAETSNKSVVPTAVEANVENSSKNVIEERKDVKVDDKTAVAESEKILEDILPKAKENVELSKTLLCSKLEDVKVPLKIDSGSEKPSIAPLKIDETKKSDIEKPSTNLEADDKGVAKPVVVMKGDNATKVENAVKTTEEKKVVAEKLEIKTPVKDSEELAVAIPTSKAKFSEELAVAIPTSQVEVIPAEIKKMENVEIQNKVIFSPKPDKPLELKSAVKLDAEKSLQGPSKLEESNTTKTSEIAKKTVTNVLNENAVVDNQKGVISNKVEEKKVENTEQILVVKTTEPTATVKDTALLTKKQEAIVPFSELPQTKVNLTKPAGLEAPSLSTAISRVEDVKPPHPVTKTAECTKSPETIISLDKPKEDTVPPIKASTAPKVMKDQSELKTEEVNEKLTLEKTLPDKEIKNAQTQNKREPNDSELGKSSIDLIDLNDLGVTPPENKERENLVKSLETDIVKLDQQLKTAQTKEAVKVIKPEAISYVTSEKPKPSEPTAPEKVKPTEMLVKAENKTNITSVMKNTDFVNQQVSKAVLIRSSASVTGHNKTIEIPKFTPDPKNSQTQDVSKKDTTKVVLPADSKPKSINNNAPCDVPFGKWTEANKQQYLNKIRETKVSTNNSNQLKQAHDLNRRDVLKKIESQRQSNNIAAANAAKNHEIMLNHNKPSVKNETPVFINKAAVKIDPSSKIPMKTESANKPDSTKIIGPNLTITPVMRPVESIVATSSTATFGKKEPESAYVAKKEFSVPNTANIAKRETNPLHYPFNFSKRDIIRNANAMKRETASTSSANLIIVAPNVPISMKRETPMPRATNLTKRESASFSNANITKVEIIAPPTVVAKKEIMSTSNAHVPTRQNAVPSGMNLTKKEAPMTSQTVTKKETTASGTNVTKKETDKVDPKKDPNRPTNQDLIDKTIEDYLLMERKPMTMSREAREALKEKERAEKAASSKQKGHSSKSKKDSPMDEIEMQMNELHGIPFIERPPHELPYRYSSEIKSYSKNESRPKVLPMSKVNKLPNLMPLQKTQDSKLKASGAEDLSDEEIIEHEPITGDIELNIKKDSSKVTSPVSHTVTQSTSPKKVITETDFDKFVRRNSITYENCITVNYGGNKQQNVVRPVIGKDAHPKGFPHTDISHLSMPQHQNKGISNSSRFVPIQADDGYNANYHSKLQIAYQSALTAKQKNSPITVIEDKPVKVVFVDNNTEFNPSQLNVQGKELSPAKKVKDPEVLALSSCDSMDSDVMDTATGTKSQDLAKKQKHQRKQVLTPVEAPEPELIEPTDLGLEVSPKKKRKTDESPKTFAEKNYAKGVSKKTYILGRSVPDDDSKETSQTEQQRSNNVTSAIDSLVKAAELLENQSEQSNTTIDSQNSQPTAVKRGRGRPRKYPLPDGVSDRNRKVPTPQKKPRVEKKYDTSSDDSQDDEMVRENWTMGKINEDIVCPICNKLFRSENVVYKHVKHCTGPSPNRSDGGTRSRERNSQETDSKYRDESLESIDMESQTTNKTNVSKDVSETTDELILASHIKSRRISEKRDHVPTKGNETRKSLHNAKATHKTNNLVCEFCGKTFRQLSYLVSHKLQHKSDAVQRKDPIDKESASNNKPTPSVFNCEVCNKKFRKLHHLVQHRIIHNPPNVASKLRRKSSADNSERVTAVSNSDSSKTTEDQSAAFRCEPCDKSFRKLHHLVEHRETHDGINRQKNPVAVPTSAEKVAPPPPQCDVCKKTFRKLHHLIEHKEQHVDLNSEKSDDKSVKSALSTKDIIHECSLCYMVFPNEHSLMKHTVFCQRKKRQSKQSNLETEDLNSQESIDSGEVKAAEDGASKVEVEEKVPEETDKFETEHVTSAKKTDVEVKKPEMEVKKPEKVETTKEIPPEPTKPEKVVEKITEMPPAKEEPIPKAKPETESKTTESLTKPKPHVIDTIVIEDTPKKDRKTPAKNKLGSTVTKRRRTSNFTLPKLDENKPLSDEDDIRYMFNPNFKIDDNPEEKTFMRVRGLKRNSLQIERPKSSVVKRRTSLQHPPKVSRLKLKTEPTSVSKTPKTEPVPSTDSDDSDTVKYSFPTTIPEAAVPKLEPKVSEKKKRQKSVAVRRKSLVGIAKRKSVGKTLGKQAKVLQAKTVVKKRLPDAGHRCDCGQLFSSAALLARHTTLAHTPPRIRRRRSPPPPPDTKPPATKATKDTKKAATTKALPKPSADKPARKSLEEKTPKKRTSKVNTSTVTKGTGVKKRRSVAHSGVPVPEKMRKLMEKLNK